MRIALHLQVLQTPSRFRGMGRYTFNLLREFMRLRPDHDYILVGNENLASFRDEDLSQLLGRTVYLPYTNEQVMNERTLSQFINASSVDLFIECSPFESELDHAVVPKIVGLVSARTCAILYDVIPAIFPEVYLKDTGSRVNYARKLSLLTESDFLLSISEWSRLDLIRHFEVSPRVIGVIGGGVDAFFYDDDSRKLDTPVSPRIERILATRFIFCLGGGEWRKNECKLIDAYSLLPEDVRARHLLVFAHSSTPAAWQRFADHAEERGVGGRVVHTGFVEDHELKLLYENCALFVFPSLYEGYGLPIAEAIVCGAPVLTSNISSMPEVCGGAAELIDDPTDAEEISEKIFSILTDDALMQNLKERSRSRRGEFRWNRVAKSMDRHLRKWMGENIDLATEVSSDASFSGEKVAIAIFTPLPPIRSGISDYISDLLPHLRKHFEIDLFIDDGYSPDEADPRLQGCGIFNHREFPRLFETRNYRFINHQLGSSEFHIFQLKWILEYPSVIMLHDPTLAGLMFVNEARNPGLFPELKPDLILKKEIGVHRAKNVFEDLSSGRYGMESLVEKGIFFNRFVFEYADAVMMQTNTAVAQFSALPSSVESASVHYSPQPVPLPDLRKGVTSFRERFGIPQKATLVSSFGILHRVKQPVSLFKACRLSRMQGRDIHLAFVGDDSHAPEVREIVEETGSEDWVHFCGHLPMEDFYEGLQESDVVACLRYPCQEQLSAAMLRSLSCGKAVLASDVPSNRQLPDSVIYRIPGTIDPSGELNEAISRLADNPDLRFALGAAAREYVKVHHDPDLTAQAYVDAFHSVDSASMIRKRSKILGLIANIRAARVLFC